MDEHGDDAIRSVFRETKVIAVIRASANPKRPSFYIADFLRQNGYEVFAINPGLAGKVLHGNPVYANLSEIPSTIKVDMVDIFRQTDLIPDIVDDAMEHLPHLRTIWMQLGLSHSLAALKASEAGLTVVQDRCPKIELPRLYPNG